MCAPTEPHSYLQCLPEVDKDLQFHSALNLEGAEYSLGSRASPTIFWQNIECYTELKNIYLFCD